VSQYLPYIIIGVITGSVYGIAALGLVLTYKTSGVFNFGHGAIAAAAAVAFYQLHVRHGWPWPIAAVVAVLVFGVTTGIIMERLASALVNAPTSYRIIATVALILIVPAANTLLFSPLAVPFPVFLPNGVAFRISGVRVGWDGVATFVLALGSAIGMYAFFRISRLGMSMRAVVDRPQLVDLTGDSPARIRRIAWIVGCCFAAVSGVLLAQTQQQLDIVLLSLLVVQAFGAAAVGAFRSLPLAYAGGMLLGLFQGFAGKLTASNPSLQGLDTNMPFLFLLIALLVVPKVKLVELGERVRRRAAPRFASGSARRAIAGSVLVLGLLLPQLVGHKLPVWNTALAQLLLFLSLGLLVNTSGQISLCHIGFVAIGATTFAHAQAGGFPWGLAVLFAGLAAVPVGAIVAIPAIRLSGLYLALATLGFGVMLSQFFYLKSFMFGNQTGLVTSRPHILGLGTDKGYYYLLLAFGVAGIAFVTTVERSRIGRLLRGMADSPTALTALGTNTNITRVLIFCTSAFLAAVSGALAAGLFGSINRDQYQYLYSAVVLAVLMVCGRRTVAAAVVASVALTVPPAYLGGGRIPVWTQLLFGLAAALVAVVAGGGAVTGLGRAATKYRERLQGPAGARWAESETSRDRPLALSMGEFNR
jgi:branched-subunit amino acid ABC-type transport system permease component